jgi:hypothetical protein
MDRGRVVVMWSSTSPRYLTARSTPHSALGGDYVPLLAKPDGEEKFVESCREVFRRGVRLNEDVCRRLRDLLMVQLRGLGCSAADIAHVVSLPISERQVRNRLAMMPRFDDVRVSMAKVLVKTKRHPANQSSAERLEENHRAP